MGLSADGLARILGIEGGRTVRRWEAGDRELPGPVVVVMETALGYLRKIDMLSQQLDLLRSGRMHTGTNGVDDTEGTIAALSEARKSYEEAYEILIRQPPPNSAAKEVHWYHLRCLTPHLEAGTKDDWSLPGELSPQAALVVLRKARRVWRRPRTLQRRRSLRRLHSGAAHPAASAAWCVTAAHRGRPCKDILCPSSEPHLQTAELTDATAARSNPL